MQARMPAYRTHGCVHSASQCSPCLNGELPGKSDRRAGTESTGMIIWSPNAHCCVRTPSGSEPILNSTCVVDPVAIAPGSDTATRS